MKDWNIYLYFQFILKSLKSIFFKYPVTESEKILQKNESLQKKWILVDYYLEEIIRQQLEELIFLKEKKVLVLEKLKLCKTDPAKFELLKALKALEKREVVIAGHVHLLLELWDDVLNKNQKLIWLFLFLMWVEFEDKRTAYVEDLEYSLANRKRKKKELSESFKKLCNGDKPIISYPEELEEPILDEYLSLHFHLWKSVWNKNKKLIKWLLFLRWVEYRIVERNDYIWLCFLFIKGYLLWGQPWHVIWNLFKLSFFVFVIYIACYRFPPRD